MSKLGCAFVVAALCSPALLNAQTPMSTTGSVVIASGVNCTTTSPATDLIGDIIGASSTTGPCTTPHGEYVFQNYPSGQIPKVVTYLPQVVDGGVWKTTIVIANITASAATARLACFQESGAFNGGTQPWTPLPFGQNVTIQSVNLAPGGTVFLDSPGTNPTLSQGWCTVTASDGVKSHAVFSLALNNSQGIAPAALTGSDILVPVDDTNGSVTAVAIANPSSSEETFTALFENADGSISQPATFTAEPNGHNTFLLPDLIPQSARRRGLAEFIVNGTASLTALQFNSTLNFTSAQTYPVSNGPVIGAIDPTVCVQSPLAPGCPNPAFFLLTLNANFSLSSNTFPMVVNITPGPASLTSTLGQGCCYTASLSGLVNGQTVTGSFIGGNLTVFNNVVTFKFQDVGQGSTFLGGSLNFSIAETDFDGKLGEAVGSVAGQLVLTQANVGGGTINGKFNEITPIAAGPWLVDVQ
jgi:hypothetical protein